MDAALYDGPLAVRVLLNRGAFWGRDRMRRNARPDEAGWTLAGAEARRGAGPQWSRPCRLPGRTCRAQVRASRPSCGSAGGSRGPVPLTGRSAVNERNGERGGRKDAPKGRPARERPEKALSHCPDRLGRSRKPLRILALKRPTPGDLWPGVSR